MNKDDIFLERVMQECKNFFMGGPGARYGIFAASGMGHSSRTPFNRALELLVSRGRVVNFGKAGDLNMMKSGIRKTTDIYGMPGQMAVSKEKTKGTKAPPRYQRDIFSGQLGKGARIFEEDNHYDVAQLRMMLR